MTEKNNLWYNLNRPINQHTKRVVKIEFDNLFIKIPRKMKEDLKVSAARERKTMTKIIVELLSNHLGIGNLEGNNNAKEVDKLIEVK